MDNKVTHFEIPSDNPEVIMNFFKNAFGWKYIQFGTEPYWLAMTGDEKTPGINGGIMKKKHPQQPCVNSISVENIDNAIANVEKSGGEIVVPKGAIPGVGWLAYFKDPDGNIHGIMQNDNTAK